MSMLRHTLTIVALLGCGSKASDPTAGSGSTGSGSAYSDSIQVYSVEATGKLTGPISSIKARRGLFAFTIEPNGKFAYAAIPLINQIQIFAINAAVPTRFVAKSEVRRWPLVGWLCVKADTLFIERARPRDLARIDTLIADALRGGDGAGAGMGVFLEGTTTDGSEVLPFHSSLLRPAQQANIDVHPVAIQYRRSDGSICTEAAYDGDKTLLDTVRLMLTQREINVQVHFLPPLPATGVHRKELARQTREVIVQRIYGDG